MKQNLIGNRYKNLEDLKTDLEKLHNCKVINIFESESERLEDSDFMIDYELENDEKEAGDMNLQVMLDRTDIVNHATPNTHVNNIDEIESIEI